MITVLNRNNHKINELRGKYAKAIKSGQEKNISDEMNQILSENSDMHSQIKIRINDMKAKVEVA